MEYKKEIHVLIIWSEATCVKEEILEIVNQHFKIKRIFTNSWKKDQFLTNLIPFYAHSQKEKSKKDYINLLKNKISHCGSGLFTIVVFEDQNPIYDYRETSNGKRLVNINVFDRKKTFRNMTGGGHKIHATDNVFESNKDLTIFFGKNTKDFCEHYQGYSTIDQKSEFQCFGVVGFKNIKDLFYLLNNSIDYCVLRNFECLPDKYTLEGHGDIDMLVENLNYVLYLTNAQSVFPKLNYRVHYTIKIGGEKIPFDFRYVGDNYYDNHWEIAILESKEKFKNLINVPDNNNHFFSLLYHAYLQKGEIKADYFVKLKKVAELNGTSYHPELNKREVKNILDQFLAENNYCYALPKDLSVYFNSDFAFIDQAFKNNENGKEPEILNQSEDDMFFSLPLLKISPSIYHNKESLAKKINHIRLITQNSEPNLKTLIRFYTRNSSLANLARSFFYKLRFQLNSIL
ncbi:hypothetical protein N9242_03790 [Vicingaceae bacterium]|jgi:hypothetical protein|nr:hypothetical protein [Vicingaceae bacterium]